MFEVSAGFKTAYFDTEKLVISTFGVDKAAAGASNQFRRFLEELSQVIKELCGVGPVCYPVVNR